jgi:hypothetical protein
MTKLRGGTPIWRWRDVLSDNGDYEILANTVYTDYDSAVEDLIDMEVSVSECSDLESHSDDKLNCSICKKGLMMGSHCLDIGFSKKAKQKWPTMILKRRYCSLYCAKQDYLDKDRPIHNKPVKPKKRKGKK